MNIRLLQWKFHKFPEDVRRILNLSCEDYERAIKGAYIYTRGGSNREVKDRFLYDTLGVEPNATSSEIKKAYHHKARQLHPDRNPDDPEATRKFQDLGDAYLILSDDHRRLEYDCHGIKCDSRPSWDVGSLFAMLLGSEKFEKIVGSMAINHLITALILGKEVDLNTNASNLQELREYECALHLLAKISPYVDGSQNAEAFTEAIRAEMDELSETALSRALLGLVANAYCDRVTMESTMLEGFGVSMFKNAEKTADSWSMLPSTFNTISAALSMRDKAKREEDAKAFENFVAKG
jgi:hypothetical protein